MKLLAGFVLLSQVLCFATTAAPAQADVSAADFPSIQAALDALPPAGGRVFIPAGIYILKGSLKPRDNVTISGAGPATVLKACDQVVGTSSKPLAVGDTEMTLESATGFEVGMEVFTHKAGNYDIGPWSEKVFSYAITAIEGNVLKFDKAAVFAQPVGAAVCTGTPPILVFKKRNVVIENLTIDGNCQNAPIYVNLKMAGVYFWGAIDCTIQNCQILNGMMDGIVAAFPPPGFTGDQPWGWAGPEKHEGNGIMILNNQVRKAKGFGIHIGGGQNKSIIKGNIVRDCGSDGFFWCWDNTYGILTGNIFTNNGGHGIGGLGSGGAPMSDSQNVISSNVCLYNGQCGIEINGGEGNVVSGNVCFGNSRSKKGEFPGIRIHMPYPDAKEPNKIYDLNTLVMGNSCNDVGEGATQKCAVEVAANVTGVVVKDNLGKGNLGNDILPGSNPVPK